MIRTESEYRAAVSTLTQQCERLRNKQQHLKQEGLCSDEIKRLLDPERSFQLQLAEEVEDYERLKRGETNFAEPRDMQDIGILLVRLRIASGVTQKELAERVGVHESQVSRDERNEYHGVTAERATRIAKALGFDLRIGVNQTTT